MIDFHSHILPGMDDGASSPEESVAMLEMSAGQGVNHIFATSHFYPYEEDPSSFLRRRKNAHSKLIAYAAGREKSIPLPEIHLGAEVYYFPGISTCEDIVPLALGETKLLLVEPPMIPFSSSMLDEIEEIGPNLGLIPVIAHLDRYCRFLRDNTLFDLLSERRVLIQVNASFFLHRDSRRLAMEMLEKSRFQLLGSDCHNTTTRAPNIGLAVEEINKKNLGKHLANITEAGYNILSLNR